MFGRQKGLVESMDEVLPGTEHRHCLWNLYTDFKDEGFKGKMLKDLLWKVACAYTTHEFEEHMSKIQSVESKAAEWLRKINPTCWTRSHFSALSKCNVLHNNCSESFNSMILKARDKPIIQMADMEEDDVIFFKPLLASNHPGICDQPNLNLRIRGLAYFNQDTNLA